MSRKAILMALRRAMGARGGGMLPEGGSKKMLGASMQNEQRLTRVADRGQGFDAAEIAEGRAANTTDYLAKRTTRPNNANPVSVVDDEFNPSQIKAELDDVNEQLAAMRASDFEVGDMAEAAGAQRVRSRLMAEKRRLEMQLRGAQ